jgi:hypothetical protein
MIEQGREPICAMCDHYTFKCRKDDDTEQGWAFCLFFDKHFPRQTVDEKAAGLRTCKNWK